MMQKLATEIEDQKVFAVWAVSSLFDCACLVTTALAQWTVDQVVNSLQLAGINYWVLVTIQLLLAIATLAPILAHTSVSVIRCFVKMRIAIEKELTRV